MRAIGTGLLVLSFVVVAAEAGEVSELAKKLKDKDSDVRRAAAKELGDLGEGAKAAVVELTKALKDEDLFVRRYAAEALGKVGPEAKGSVPALARAMNDEKKEVQLAAVEALGKIGTEAAPALIAAVKDPGKDPGVRKKAAQGLAKIGPSARGAVQALSDVVTGKIASPKGDKKAKTDDDVRVDAATALGAVAKASDKAAVAALKSVSEGKQRNRPLQKAASEAMKKIAEEKPETKDKKKGG